MIEVLIALSLFGVAVALIEIIVISIRTDALISQRLRARSLVLDQLEVIRELPFDSLPTRSITTDFFGTVWNQGNWTLESLQGSTVLKTNGTGSHWLVVPGDHFETVTIQNRFYVESSTPPGYEVGYYLRIEEGDSGYRLRMTAGGTFVERIQSGTASTLSSLSQSLPVGQWTTVSFSANGATLTATVAGQTVSVTDPNPFLTDGQAALWSAQGCCVLWDDLQLQTSSRLDTWNWERPEDAIGTLPLDWRRLSLSDLPAGTGQVEIQPIAGVELTQLTIRVEWLYRNEPHQELLTTYVTRYGIQSL